MYVRYHWPMACMRKKRVKKEKAVTFTLGCYIPLPQGAVQKNLRGMCNFSAIVQDRWLNFAVNKKSV